MNIKKIIKELQWIEEPEKDLFIGKGKDFYLIWINDGEGPYNVQFIDKRTFNAIVNAYIFHK